MSAKAADFPLGCRRLPWSLGEDLERSGIPRGPALSWGGTLVPAQCLEVKTFMEAFIDRLYPVSWEPVEGREFSNGPGPLRDKTGLVASHVSDGPSDVGEVWRAVFGSGHLGLGNATANREFERIGTSR